MRKIIVQIFGKKNCSDTRKAERFFKERGIKYQFINILEKSPSKREVENFLKIYSKEDLIDVNGKEYTKRNLQYIVYEPLKLLEETPILYRTPIIRKDNKVFIGSDIEELKKFI
ncbi:MAG: arsenate reductase family protein [Cetobacterium sp.]|uniref:arsenate reductase family protein n=1 Tax=Cetobacterium sp. TaxID=2071632 RepID=UPI003F3300F2